MKDRKIVKLEEPSAIMSMPQVLFQKLFGHHFADIVKQVNNMNLGQRYSQSLIHAELTESKKNYYLQLELPGVQKEDIDIELEDSSINVSGFYKKSSGKKVDKRDLFKEEKFKFRKSFSLPSGTIPELIKASYRNGVLNITLPKGKKSKIRKIEVE